MGGTLLLWAAAAGALLLWGAAGGLAAQSDDEQAAGHERERTEARMAGNMVAPSAAMAEKLPALDSTHLAIEDHPERRELVLSFGPIDLPAHTSHHALRQLPIQTGRIPFNLTLRGYRVDAIDKDGRPVPQAVIHHFNLLDPERRELFLPIMRRVLAASHETKPQSLPGWLFGLPLVSGDRFLLLAMLHNPTDRTYEGVHVRLIVQYERRERLPLYRFYPFHIDVMFPVGSKAFDLPPGKSSKSWEGSPAIAAGIIGLGGHLHKYATGLVLEDLTDGRTLYRIRPRLDADGEIDEVPVQFYSGKGLGALIYPSHTYRVTATYYNPTGRPIPDGGMGSVAGVVIPLKEWPRAEFEDAIYAADYRAVLTSLSMGAMGGMEALEEPHGGPEH